MAPADEAPVTATRASRPVAARGRDGFFRALQDETGTWWLIDPHGGAFFLRCVHGVRVAGSQHDGALPPDSAARLRRWGFNAAGVVRDSELRDDGLPFLVAADFSGASQTLLGPGLRLPDVFDPAWPRRAGEHARRHCPSLTGRVDLVGWVTDDTLEWAAPSPAGRPSLLQLCLSLEPRFSAYHAAWEFVLAHHGGRLERVAQAWNCNLPNKEVVRELTRAEEGLGTRGYLRDDAQWAREFARRYFTATGDAIRQADPNHLVLGCRFRSAAGAAVLAECVYPAVDVSMPHWSELPAGPASRSQPAIAGDVSWVSEGFMRSTAGRRSGRLTKFERMLRKARTTLDRVAQHRSVVGYAWARWQDEPGEQPPFAGGLVHVNGTEACEHTELLAHFNLRAENLHRNSAAAADESRGV